MILPPFLETKLASNLLQKEPKPQIYPALALSSCRREESVEIEWQCVELFVPVIAFERPELDPPRHAPVLLRRLHVQGVVEEHGYHQRDGRGRHEYGVEERVELH